LHAVAEIPYATDAPKPLTPAESIAAFQLPDDLRIEIVASEPLIAEPGAMVFDEFGYLFVGQLHGYNLEGYYDILEVNKTGELDEEVRRVHVEGPLLERARDEAVGVIKRLEDVDGDGHFETGQIWAELQHACYGLIRARDGLIAVCPPEILFLADRDGDGRAEFQETLFSGFGFELLERGINSPRRGVDNWIYIAAGGGGGTITGPHLAAPVALGHTDFRIREDGSAIEPVTGTCHTFGQALTESGDRFVSSTNRHALYAPPLEYRHLVRNPYVPSPGGNVDAANYEVIFPTSEPDPWRQARNADPAWVKFYGERETTPNGYFTASCGAHILRGGALPERFQGNHFACEPANNLVHRSVLTRDGAGYSVRRAPGEETSEFLTSTDRWFRPINLESGPDGGLYIVDFYREIIEDYSAIPRHLQQRYVESLRAGYQHGRIWRVTAKDGPPFKPATLGKATIEELVASLESDNPWVRETAQRLLINLARPTDAPLLRTLRDNSNSPAARLHALYILDTLKELKAEDIQSALEDKHYTVRLHALRLAEGLLDTSPTLREKALKLIDDSDPSVRLQAAQSLGASDAPEVTAALASAAAQFGGERWMSPAIVSSAASRPVPLIEVLLPLAETNPAVMEVLPLLATTAAAQGGVAEVNRVLELTKSDTAAPVQIALLDGLAEGLAHAQPETATDDHEYGALIGLLSADQPQVRQRAIRLAGLLHLGDSPVMQTAWAEAEKTALDAERTLEERVAATDLLFTAPWERKAPLAGLLDSREPLELQLAAIRMIDAASDDAVGPTLVERFNVLTPRAQEATLSALFAQEARLTSVLDAVERGTIQGAVIPSIWRLQLLENASPAIRDRAKALLANPDGNERLDVIASFRPALNLPRDVARGRVLFEERCGICHVLRGVGQEVGPDLSAVRTRPDEALLADMLDPSGTITAGFNAYLVETEDGGLYTGMLAEETATSITLRRARGETDTILRSQITDIRTSSLSLMPDGLEEGLTQEDVANLLGFLRDATGEVVSSSIVVFDDEPEFVAALAEGTGDAILSEDGPYAGSGFLRVTPPQRHSPRIAGWQYRVVEKPALSESGVVEEIRYLRLAWRTEGDGVMIELADNGVWPAAESSLRRYYSGTNTTNWQAKELSNVAPREWTVITVDLWQDFGEFTLTGIAPTAMGGAADFDRLELLASLDGVAPQARRTNATQ
jgi:putative membrane-bound dehydrogenase-like protein